MDISNITGQRLRESRLKKGLTQIQVMETTKIHNKTLSGYENDVSEPDFGTLKILADLYGVSTDYLLGLTNDPTQPRPIITPVAIGEKIKQAREEARLSQAQLAQKIGQTVLAIKYMEKGSRKVMSEQLNEIAHALGKPLSFFMPETTTPRALKPRDEIVPTKPIPLVGKITAGGPNFALQEKLGEIRVSKYLDAEFGLIVKGDSMIGAGITHGDIVVCKKARSADHGDIVVALVNGGETTLKYLIKDGDTWLLRAANPKYHDIVLHPEDDKIQGIVVKIDSDPVQYDDSLKPKTEDYIWAEVGKDAAKYGISPEQARRLLVTFGKMQQGIDDEEDDDD